MRTTLTSPTTGRTHSLQHPRRAATALALSAALALLAGCGEAEDTTSADPAETAASPADTAAGTAAETAADEDAVLTLDEGWAKATDDHMTGVFGTLVNHGDDDIHLVAVESPVAGMGELHVTVDDGAGGRLMQEAEDGFTIPAGEQHELVPGGDHIMLMELTDEIATGQDVEVTLTAEDGAEVVVTVTARAFAGAEEDYAPGDGAGHTMDDGHDDASTTQ